MSAPSPPATDGLASRAGWAVVRALTVPLRSPLPYELAIRGFEAQEVPPGALIFLGSSTIRMWSTLARDFAPRPAVNRGFGGAVVSQVLHFAERLLPEGADPAAVVLYCGGNDLAWGVPVEVVLAQTEAVLAIARSRLPGVPVYLISVGKTPARRLSWSRVEALNRGLEALAAETGARWVDVTAAVAGPDGRPRGELFLMDGIHPSPAGYAVWTAVLRPLFDRGLP